MLLSDTKVSAPWSVAPLDKYCLNINLPSCVCLMLRKMATFLL